VVHVMEHRDANTAPEPARLGIQVSAQSATELIAPSAPVPESARSVMVKGDCTDANGRRFRLVIGIALLMVEFLCWVTVVPHIMSAQTALSGSPVPKTYVSIDRLR